MRYLLAGDQVNTSKHLDGYMKTVFAEDLLREALRYLGRRPSVSDSCSQSRQARRVDPVRP